LAPEAFGAFVLATRPPPSLSYGAPREVAFQLALRHDRGSALLADSPPRATGSLAQGAIEILEKVSVHSESHFLYGSISFAIDPLSRIRKGRVLIYETTPCALPKLLSFCRVQVRSLLLTRACFAVAAAKVCKSGGSRMKYNKFQKITSTPVSASESIVFMVNLANRRQRT
jgi:hypothetical protein